jgi:glutathione synthase
MSYASLLSQWPPQLSNHELKELTSQAASYAVTHALQYLPPRTSADCSSTPASAIHAPMTLFPTPFPRKLFEHARKLQSIYNVLYARIAMDKEFIDDIMEGLGDPEDFVFQLWKHWKALGDEDIVQVSWTF